MSKIGRVVSIILMVVIIPALARHGVGVIPAALVGAGIGAVSYTHLTLPTTPYV